MGSKSVRINLRTKLSLPYGIIGLLFLGFFFFNLYFVNNQLYVLMDSKSSLYQTQAQINAIASKIQTGILTTDDILFIEVAEESLLVLEEMEAISHLFPEETSVLVETYHDYYVSMVGISSLFLENRLDEANQSLIEIERLQIQMDDAILGIEGPIERRLEQAIQRVNFILLLILLLLLLLFFSVVIYYVPYKVIRPINKITQLATSIASGELNLESIKHTASDETGILAKALNTMLFKLQEVIKKTQDVSRHVYESSNELNSSNQDLAQRTEEQVASLERVSSTIEIITKTLESSSTTSWENNQFAEKTLETVKIGEAVILEMREAMQEITQRSHAIEEILSNLNDISFQTDLLALNASVEAARAGEEGRGFAVVATEVRNLAVRSAEFSQEMEKLMKANLEGVETGNQLMEKTAKVLNEIIGNTQKTVRSIRSFSDSLQEKSKSAHEIKEALAELTQVSQYNSSMVEEVSATSAKTNEEIGDLEEVISFFKLEEKG